MPSKSFARTDSLSSRPNTPRGPLMDSIILDGGLEIRRGGGGRILSGSFPLGRQATVRSNGRVRKERFKRGGGGRSVSWQYREFQKLQAQLAEDVSNIAADVISELEDQLEKRNSFLLVGHDYDKTIADTLTGNLALNFSDDAVNFSATLPDEAAMPSWVLDAVKAVEGGQLRGVSPGFQVPSKGSERLIPEPGNPSVMIREIEDSVVFEWSLVSRPAYSGTDITARNDAVSGAQDAKPGRATLWL